LMAHEHARFYIEDRRRRGQPACSRAAI
jgi:hypothetical protein